MTPWVAESKLNAGSAKFSSTWFDALPILVANGRAQVGVVACNDVWNGAAIAHVPHSAAAASQLANHEDYAVGS